MGNVTISHISEWTSRVSGIAEHEPRRGPTVRHDPGRPALASVGRVDHADADRRPAAVVWPREDIALGVRSILRRHPVAGFLALTFLISWGWILAMVAPDGFPVSPDRFEQRMVFVYPAMFLGPSISGVLLTGLVAGRAGYRDLAARLVRWRVGVRWWTVALLATPLIVVAVLIALSLAWPRFVPLIVTADDRVFLIVYPVVAGLATAFCEELGWTGFAATTMLQQRRSAVRTGLGLGIAFAIWNALVVGWSGAGVGTMDPVLFLTVALFTWLPAFRVLLVWVYDRTRSLLVAIVMSASLWASWISFTPQRDLAGAPLAGFYVVLAAVSWFVIVGLIVAGRARQVVMRSPLHS